MFGERVEPANGAAASPRASACSSSSYSVWVTACTPSMQFRAVREARVFLFKLRDFVGLEPQRLQFTHLVAQQFQTRLAVGALALKRVQALGQGLQRAMLFRHLGGCCFEPGIGIERIALGIALEQRLMLVLAVDVHQQIAELAQLLHRHRAAVDEGLRRFVGFDRAPQHALAVVEQLLRFQPARRGGGGLSANAAVTSARAQP